MPSSRYPHQFSGGQPPAIAIPGALIGVSIRTCWCADEAVSRFDVSVHAQSARTARRNPTLSRHRAFCFITHEHRVAAHICDDVAVMRAWPVSSNRDRLRKYLTNRNRPIHGNCWTPPPAGDGILRSFRPVALGRRRDS